MGVNSKQKGEEALKRKIAVTLLIVICFILQCTVFQALELASIAPNLLIVVTSSLGFMRGKKEGIVVGLFSGFLIDLFFGQFLGFYSFIYMCIGYVNGFFHHIFYDEDVKLPMVLITLSELSYGLLVYFFMFLLRSRFAFPFYLGHVIIPELVYTVVVTIVLYRVILALNRRLEIMENERSEEY